MVVLVKIRMKFFFPVLVLIIIMNLKCKFANEVNDRIGIKKVVLLDERREI